MMSRSRGALVLAALLTGWAGQVAAETGLEQPDEAFCRSSASAGCECSFRPSHYQAGPDSSRLGALQAAQQGKRSAAMKVFPRDILTFAGRNGPAMLFSGVLIGLIAPPLAEAARPLLGLAVFVFTLGAFLKVDLISFRKEIEQRAWIAGVLAWTTFGVPLVALGLIALVRPEAGLAQGLMLCTLAPPVGSAAAIAAMLGLSAPLALLATVTATVVSAGTATAESR